MLSELSRLLMEGYNPVYKTIVAEAENNCGISEHTPWVQALREVAIKLKLEGATVKDLKSCLGKIKSFEQFRNKVKDKDFQT